MRWRENRKSSNVEDQRNMIASGQFDFGKTLAKSGKNEKGVKPFLT